MFESISLEVMNVVVGGQGQGQPPAPQYGAPGTSGNPEGRGRTLYQNGSGSQTARDAAHLLEQGGRALNPFNWGTMATETYEGYRRGGIGGGFLSLLGVEH